MIRLATGVFQSIDQLQTATVQFDRPAVEKAMRDYVNLTSPSGIRRA